MRYQKRFFNLLKVSSPGNMDHLVLNELHSYSVISQSSSNFTINFSLCFIDVFICWSVYRRMVCTSKVCSWRVPDGTELTRCHFWYQYLLVWPSCFHEQLSRFFPSLFFLCLGSSFQRILLFYVLPFMERPLRVLYCSFSSQFGTHEFLNDTRFSSCKCVGSL